MKISVIYTIKRTIYVGPGRKFQIIVTRPILYSAQLRINCTKTYKGKQTLEFTLNDIIAYKWCFAEYINNASEILQNEIILRFKTIQNFH